MNATTKRIQPDFLAAMAAMFGVLIFDTLPGLFIGIGVSFVLLVYRSSHPQVATLGKVPGTDLYADLERHPENAIVAGVMVVRVEGALFFANTEAVADSIRSHVEAPGVRAVVLDAVSIPFVDISAVHVLANLFRDLHASGVCLVFAHDTGQVWDFLKASGSHRLMDGVYPTVDAAVEAVT